MNQIPEIMESPDFHDLRFAKLSLKKTCNILSLNRELLVESRAHFPKVAI